MMMSPPSIPAFVSWCSIADAINAKTVRVFTVVGDDAERYAETATGLLGLWFFRTLCEVDAVIIICGHANGGLYDTDDRDLAIVVEFCPMCRTACGSPCAGL